MCLKKSVQIYQLLLNISDMNHELISDMNHVYMLAIKVAEIAQFHQVFENGRCCDGLIGKLLKLLKLQKFRNCSKFSRVADVEKG